MKRQRREATETVEVETKVCKDCLQSLPATQEFFYRSSHQRVDGSWTLQPRCKECDSAKNKKYHQDNLEEQRRKGREKAQRLRDADPVAAAEKQYAYRVKKQYGITIDEVNQMWDDQDGCCAICGEPEPDQPDRFQRMHVDHDHETGVVRGLLCSRCNQGLGYFQDDPDRLEAAAQYLRRISIPAEDDGATPDGGEA